MPTSTTFTLQVDPQTCTHQSKQIAYVFRGGNRVPTLVDTPELKRVRALYLGLLLSQRNRPMRPMEGMLRVSIRFVFKSEDWKPPEHCSNPGGDYDYYDPRKGAPDADLDNMTKTLIDAMVDARYLVDDIRIVSMEMSKLQGGVGHIVIQLVELRPMYGQLARKRIRHAAVRRNRLSFRTLPPIARPAPDRMLDQKPAL